MDQEAILAMLHDLSTRLDSASSKVKPDQTVSVVNRPSNKTEVLSPYWSCIREVGSGTALGVGSGQDWDQKLRDSTNTKIEFGIPTGDGFLSIPILATDHNLCWITVDNPGAQFTTTLYVETSDGDATATDGSYIQVKINSTVSEYGPATGLDQSVTFNVLPGKNRIAITIREGSSGTFKLATIKGRFIIDGKTKWIKDNK